jgi:CBS domain-containing protein
MNKKCQEIMTEQPVCCAPEDNVQRAAHLMKNQNVGALPVCDREGSNRLVGMLTDRDITLKVVAAGRDPARTQIGEVMSQEIFSCAPGDDIENAIMIMERQQVRRVPVVDQDGRIVGIIAQADIATRLRAPETTAEVLSEVSKPSTLAGGA